MEDIPNNPKQSVQSVASLVYANYAGFFLKRKTKVPRGRAFQIRFSHKAKYKIIHKYGVIKFKIGFMKIKIYAGYY